MTTHPPHHRRSTRKQDHAAHYDWISLALTVPILALSPTIQAFLELGKTLRFPGDLWVL
jgi:hypothetical protein